jgi:hypothetical protein
MLLHAELTSEQILPMVLRAIDDMSRPLVSMSSPTPLKNPSRQVNLVTDSGWLMRASIGLHLGGRPGRRGLNERLTAFRSRRGDTRRERYTSKSDKGQA